MIWRLAPVPYRVPPALDFTLFTIDGTNFYAYRGFMLLVSLLMFLVIWLLLTRTRIGLVIQAALTNPQMVGALGHNVPRVFTIVFDLIIIDEPTEGLAPKLVEQVGELLGEIARRGVAILLVEQKLTIALNVPQRLYIMGHGRIVFEGTPAQFAANEVPTSKPRFGQCC